MKTYNAQIEEVKDLLNNISGLAIDYDCLSGEDSMKGLIDSMADWAREALVILEELPRDSRGKEVRVAQIESIQPFFSDVCTCDTYKNCTAKPTCPVHSVPNCTCNTTNSRCPIHGAKQ